MASRNTLDTNLLRVRTVTAFNPTTSDFIQPAQIPVIGDQGGVKWMSSLEFLSSISVPKVRCSVLDILNTVQPGISTMSTITASTLKTYLMSTVGGLGQSSYVSTSQMNLELDFLSQRHGFYISSTTLYDVIVALSNLSVIEGIGPIPNARASAGSRLSGGYVHTVNPGHYTRYQSSLGGGHMMNATLTSGAGYPGVTVDIGGYKDKFVNTSKLTVDVFNGVNVTFTGGAPAGTAFSTFLVSTNTGGLTVGDPVVYNIPTGTTTFSIPMSRFFIPPTGINRENVPTSLTVGYRTNTGATLTENVPTIGGIFVTLDNMD